MRVSLGLAIAVCALCSTGAAQSVDTRTLRPGVAAAGELSSGQRHTYEIIFSAGQFVAVLLTKGIEYPVVTLIDPSGRRVIESSWGELSIVTEVAGRYVLQARANEQTAPPGFYEIHVEPPQPPTAAERARAAAGSAF